MVEDEITREILYIYNFWRLFSVYISPLILFIISDEYPLRAEHTEIRVALAAGEVKMRLRSGERAPRSGPNDPVNRGAIASPDRCTANKKASARSPTPLRNPKGESAYVASPRGSCRATTTIDIVHRYISSYRPLSFSVPDSTWRGSKQPGPQLCAGPPTT